MPQHKLIIPRDEARRLLNEQVEKGMQLLNQDITNENELDQYVHDRKRYNQYNIEMLNKIFGKDDDSFWTFGFSYPSEWDEFEDRLNFYKNWDGKQVNELKGLEESLELIPEVIEKKTMEPISKMDETKTEIKLPEKITAAWLWHNAPIHFWLWALGIIVAVFLAGVTTGQTTFVQELLSKKQIQGEQVTPSNSSQNAKGVIKGLIMDQDGHPLVGTKVSVRIIDGPVVYDSNVDANGSYATPPLNPGKYAIEFDHDDYMYIQKGATVEAGQDLVINANLKKLRVTSP